MTETWQDNMEAVAEITYENGVTLYKRIPDGWPVVEPDGTRHTFASIREFVRWCRENYTWPMW